MNTGNSDRTRRDSNRSIAKRTDNVSRDLLVTALIVLVAGLYYLSVTSMNP